MFATYTASAQPVAQCWMLAHVQTIIPLPVSFHCRLGALLGVASHSEPQGNGENIRVFWAKWFGAIVGCGGDLRVTLTIHAGSQGLQHPGTQVRGMKLLCSSHLPCSCLLAGERTWKRGLDARRDCVATFIEKGRVLLFSHLYSTWFQ